MVRACLSKLTKLALRVRGVKRKVGAHICAWQDKRKATQELAKDAFDAINDQKVFAP
jgi:hypothetical protein